MRNEGGRAGRSGEVYFEVEEGGEEWFDPPVAEEDDDCCEG